MPREDFEKQINMTPEEQEAKGDFIRDLFTISGIPVHERKAVNVE